MIVAKHDPFHIELPNFKDSSFISAIDTYITNLKKFNNPRSFPKNFFVDFRVDSFQTNRGKAKKECNTY